MAQAEHPRGVAEVALGRRRFLTFLIAAPTLTVAARAISASPAAAAVPSPPQLADAFDLGDLIKLAGAPTADQLFQLTVHDDGTVTAPLPRAEVGQGITTAVSMIIAEELDIPLSQVRMPLADARPELLMNQLTGGSTTIRSVYEPARAAAAAAKARLVATAAQRWGVAADQLRVVDGVVRAPDGRTARYGSLAGDAATTDLGEVQVRPKAVEDFGLVGKPADRVDARGMVTGEHVYTMDLDVAGAKPCMVRRPPTINGTVKSVNNAAAVKRMTGIIDVARIPTGVAVLAETFALALEGVNALDVTWGPGTVDGESDNTVRNKLKSAILPFAAPPVGAAIADFEFDFAFASHGAMEMNCAVADVRPDRAEIWSALQTPIVAQQTIAKELGLAEDQVTVHVMPAGGSFGRKLFFDAAAEAAHASKAFGRAVKLSWHRTDDMRHGRVHPAKHHRVRVAHLAGNVLAYEHRVASVETDLRHGLGEIITAGSAQVPELGNQPWAQSLFNLTVHCPYQFGVVSELLSEINLKMHTASWRSVYSLSTRGVEEIVVDELAERFNKDPVTFRREFLEEERQRAVLDKVAEVGNWGRSMPAGTGQGIGFHSEMRAVTACLVELDARDAARPRVTKAVIAVDVGLAINPRGLQAQMLGGLTDAASLTIRGGLHLRNGMFLEGSYNNFHYARQQDSPPEVEVIVLQTSDTPGGAGELGLSAPFGAIANAYRRATGKRPRRFPINFEVDFEAYPPSVCPPPPMQKP